MLTVAVVEMSGWLGLTWRLWCRVNGTVFCILVQVEPLTGLRYRFGCLQLVARCRYAEIRAGVSGERKSMKPIRMISNRGLQLFVKGSMFLPAQDSVVTLFTH
jgi:hypothetical protein